MTTTQTRRRRSPLERDAIIVAELLWADRPLLTRSEQARYLEDPAMFDAIVEKLRGPPYTINFDQIFAQRSGGDVRRE
jgi:hypothetical protein